MKKISIILFVILFSAFYSELAIPQNLPSVDEIFQRMEKNWQPIEDYTVNALILVDIPGVRMPKMKAKIYFKKPNHYHFEAKGFAILPKGGLGPDPHQLKKWKKDAQLIDVDSAKQTAFYHLLVEPHHPGIPLFQIHLYVNRKTYLISKIETRHPTGSFMQINFQYKKVKSNIWLPDKIVSIFEIKATVMDSTVEKFQPKMMNGQNIFKAPFKKGKVYVYLKNYKLNTGLDTAIFNKNNKKSTLPFRKNTKEP